MKALWRFSADAQAHLLSACKIFLYVSLRFNNDSQQIISIRVFPDAQNTALWCIFNQNDPQIINQCVPPGCNFKKNLEISHNFSQQ